MRVGTGRERDPVSAPGIAILTLLAFPAGAAAGAFAALMASRRRRDTTFGEHARQALDMVSGPDDELLAELGAALRAAEEAAPAADAGRKAWRIRQERNGGGS